MAIIIDFNEFKTKQICKNSELFDFDEDLDLSDDWDNAESKSVSNTTFSKLFETIFISIKKILTVKDLNEH